jgi:hypothetical protein
MRSPTGPYTPVIVLPVAARSDVMGLFNRTLRVT